MPVRGGSGTPAPCDISNLLHGEKDVFCTPLRAQMIPTFSEGSPISGPIGSDHRTPEIGEGGPRQAFSPVRQLTDGPDEGSLRPPVACHIQPRVARLWPM